MSIYIHVAMYNFYRKCSGSLISFKILVVFNLHFLLNDICNYLHFYQKVWASLVSRTAHNFQLITFRFSLQNASPTLR